VAGGGDQRSYLVTKGESMDENISEPKQTFAYISEDADDALEFIFEHPDGVTDHFLARAMGLGESGFLIDELLAAGIAVRREVHKGVMMYLPPLRSP
jgi:hypothetical protein